MKIPHFKKIKDWFLNILFVLCLLAVIWILLEGFVHTSFRIPSDSMEPTLLAGDVIGVEKLSYGARVFDWREALQGREVRTHVIPAAGVWFGNRSSWVRYGWC